VSEKGRRIKQTLKETRERRAGLRCSVFRLKTDASHLSHEKKNHLERLFREKEWFRNAVIASQDIYAFDDKTKVVKVKRQEVFEDREIKVLSSQMRRSAIDEVKDNIKALSALKKRGKKAGGLKFLSRCNTVELKRAGRSCRIVGNRLFAQGFKKPFKLEGLEQMPEGAGKANAKLVRKPSGYYLHITCYGEKGKRERTGESVGLDFGIKDTIVDSDGNAYNRTFPETKRLKSVSKKMNRLYAKGKKRTKNHERRRRMLDKEYEKTGNRKRDAKNAFVAKVWKENDATAVQDENIAEWKSSKMKGWGERIQRSIMGGIVRDIKKLSQTVIVDKWFASTQICPWRGSKRTLALADRRYICVCGYSEERDAKAAQSI
jgi:transposase